MDAIEIYNLSKRYRGKRWRTVEALVNLNLNVPLGEVFGFLGPNGAGKSTTIKTIMGLIKPTSGRVSICNIPSTDSASRQKIGYLPENPTFYDFLTAREYLAFVGRTFGMKEELIKEESGKILELLELQDAADRSIRSYSKGMVQRLGLAQALIHDPDVFILDEPMSGLDPLGRVLVKKLITDLKSRGKTVFFSTHITADVEAVCDRVGVIVGGKLQTVDKVEQLMEAGVRGYNVLIKGAIGETLFDFEVTAGTTGAGQVYVPKQRFNEFMGRIIHAGLEIDIVEPERADLEAFFLEIVAKSTAGER